MHNEISLCIVLAPIYYRNIYIEKEQKIVLFSQVKKQKIEPL